MIRLTGDYKRIDIVDRVVNGGLVTLVDLKEELKRGTVATELVSGLPIPAVHFREGDIDVDKYYVFFGYLFEAYRIYPWVRISYELPPYYSTYDHALIVDFTNDVVRYYEKHKSYPLCYLCDAYSASSAYLYRKRGLENDDTVALMALEMLRPQSVLLIDVPWMTIPLTLYKLQYGTKFYSNSLGDLELLTRPVEMDQMKHYDMVIAHSGSLERSIELLELAASMRASIVILSEHGMFGSERASIYPYAVKFGYRYMSTPLGAGAAVLVPVERLRPLLHTPLTI